MRSDVNGSISPGRGDGWKVVIVGISSKSRSSGGKTGSRPGNWQPEKHRQPVKESDKARPSPGRCVAVVVAGN